MEQYYLTPEQVAKRLAVSPKSIREWLKTKRLNGIKIGRVWRIGEDDLKAFLFRSEQPKLAPWNSLSYEERVRRIEEIQAKCADVDISVDEFLRKKHEETEREERKSDARRRAAGDRKSALGFLADVPGSVEDFTRERHEEVEDATASWASLTREEKLARLNSIKGKYATAGRSVDDFMAEKWEEVLEEERRWEEKHRQ